MFTTNANPIITYHVKDFTWISPFINECIRDEVKFLSHSQSENLFEKNVGPYLTAIMSRSNNYNMDLDKRISIRKEMFLEEYILSLYKKSPRTSFKFNKPLIQRVVKHAFDLLDKNKSHCKYSLQELILIQLKQLTTINCVILYKDDIAPKSDYPYYSSKITIDTRFTKEDIIYRR